MRYLLLAILACGCNQILGIDDNLHIVGDGGGGTLDGAAIDSTTPDGLQTHVHDAGLTVLDAEDIDTSAQAFGGLRGGLILLQFRDFDGTDGEVVSDVGGCVVRRYQAAAVPGFIDSGAISVTGDGLLKTVGPCSFFNGAYRCVSNLASVSVSAVATNNGVVDYTFPTGTFTGENLVDSWLLISGCTDSRFDTPGGGGSFPILQQNGSTDLVVYNGQIPPAGTSASCSGLYTVQNGGGLAPVSAAQGDFLGGPTTSVTIQKSASSSWGAIDTTLHVEGDGFQLDPTNGNPSTAALPVDGTDATFSCGGTCGGHTTESTGLIVVASASDGDISTLPPFLMPPPVSELKRMTCTFPASTSGTVPGAAIQALLAGGTTRIETVVGRVSSAQPSDGTGIASIAVGHAKVGHTDAP